MICSSTSYPHWTQMYGEAKAEEGYPRVYRDRRGHVWVFLRSDDGAIQFNQGRERGDSPCICEFHCTNDLLLTGPEAAEYVAAAREGRDAVWPPKVESEWPRVMKGEDHDALGRVWVYFAENDGVVLLNDGNKYKVDSAWSEIFDGDGLITDESIRKPLISAAEAFRARESDPWPHWWTRFDGRSLTRFDDRSNGRAFHDDGTENKSNFGEDGAAKYGWTRIPSPEAAALLAKWEAERKPPQPELPTAELVAGQVVRSWRDFDSSLAELEVRIASAIRADRQARSGETRSQK